jgi:hypothetical protein
VSAELPGNIRERPQSATEPRAEFRGGATKLRFGRRNFVAKVPLNSARGGGSAIRICLRIRRSLPYIGHVFVSAALVAAVSGKFRQISARDDDHVATIESQYHLTLRIVAESGVFLPDASVVAGRASRSDHRLTWSARAALYRRNALIAARAPSTS